VQAQEINRPLKEFKPMQGMMKRMKGASNLFSGGAMSPSGML
jgi:signal recognition particle GTPase